MSPMAPFTAAMILLLAASSALSSPVVEPRYASHSLPLTRRIPEGGFKDIVKRDQARAQNFISRFLHGSKKRSNENVAVTNTAVTYTANVGVGSPPQYYTLVIDTGSSNTWVGADPTKPKPLFDGRCARHSQGEVSVSYGSGNFAGVECLDEVFLGPGLDIYNQSIGVATAAEGFSGVDGILGIGPTDLTAGTVDAGLDPPLDTVPTVIDNLFEQGSIPEHSIGIYYQPTNSHSDVNGVLTYGGVDRSKITSGVNYVPITTTSPASEYWGIDQRISYGEDLLLNSAGIVDTGTTLILIASDAFNKYQSATGGVADENTGLLTITADQFKSLQSLFFEVGGVTYELTPDAQIFPRSLNTQIGGSSDDYYLVVSNIGSPSGEGLDFINGYTFLERFYSVYDTGNGRVGFATTPWTDATTNQ